MGKQLIESFNDSEPFETHLKVEDSKAGNTVYISIMNLKEAIKYKMAEFVSIYETHNVKSLYAFGSSITDRFSEESSDIDLLIEIDTDDPMERGESLMSIWDKFEDFFQRKVD